jgi:hypothetical protein
MDFQFTSRNNDLLLSAIFASLPRPCFGVLILIFGYTALSFISLRMSYIFSFFFAFLVKTYETRFVFVLHFVISIFFLIFCGNN